MNILTFVTQSSKTFFPTLAGHSQAQVIPDAVKDAVAPPAHGRLVDCALASFRFFGNKLAHNAPLRFLGQDPQLLNSENGIQYYTARDENGVLRGGNLPWLHMQDTIVDRTLSKEAQVRSLCKKLSMLPGNAAFVFTFCPELREMDMAPVIEGFKRSGFVRFTNHTYLYKPVQGDLMAQLKSDARNKVKSAARDLDIVEMGVEEYFAFYQANLEAAHKKSYFHLGIDSILVKEALNATPRQAQIIAARKKGVDENGNLFPIEAAIVLTSGEDGYLKLLRITYRRPDPANPADEPHKHATKLLVYEALRLAVEKNLVLDTDCFSPGSVALYSRFGVFQLRERHEFKRRTVQTLLCKLVPMAGKMVQKIKFYAFSRLSCLIYQLIFAHNVFQTLQSGAL